MMTSIRNIIAAFAAIAIIAGIAGCRKDQSEIAERNLTEAVKGITFPVELKDGSKLTDLTYSDRILTFRCEMGKDKLNKLDVEKLRAETQDNLLTGLYPRNLVKNIQAAGASVRYIYVNGEDSVMLSFSPDELRIKE